MTGLSIMAIFAAAALSLTPACVVDVDELDDDGVCADAAAARSDPYENCYLNQPDEQPEEEPPPEDPGNEP
jgi:hypothetical protein